MRGMIISVIKKNNWIYGFIKTTVINYYYDSLSYENNLILKKGMIVDFDVIKQKDGRDKAVNMRAAYKNESMKEKRLDESIIKSIADAFEESTETKGYFASATVPFILKKLGINSFRDYANSIQDFINLYFSDSYRFIKEYYEGDKRYPGIVARMSWVDSNYKTEQNCINNSVSEEIINKICDDILAASLQEGFFLASSFPVLLHKYGLGNYREYADSVEDFIVRFYSEKLIVLKNVVVRGKRYPGIIVEKSKADDIKTDSSEKNISDIEESIKSIEGNLEETIKANGFITLSVLPSILNIHGVDYQKYTDNIKSFVDKYLSDKYVIKQYFSIEGRVIPDVLVKIDGINENEATNDTYIDEEYRSLNELYNNKDYLGYLSKINNAGIYLDKIDEDQLIKIFSSANQLLEGNEYTLNLFQKELITCRRGIDFIKKWKKPEGYSNTILANYAQSSIYDFNIYADLGQMTKQINNIGSDTKINNSFTSISSRFESCKDSLAFLIYLIRAVSGGANKNVEKVISEYSAFVKGLKTDSYVQKIDFSSIITGFERFVEIIVKDIICEPLSISSCTNILSVFVDLNFFDRVSGILDLICSGDSPLQLLNDFLKNYESWGQDKYHSLYSNGVSLRIIEKISAHIWEKETTSDQLSETILRMLAYSLHEGGDAVLDEIIRIHYVQGYTKIQKEMSMVNSFSIVVEKLEESDAWFLLAEYIKRYLFDNLSMELKQTAEVNSIDELNKWKDTSDSYYLKKLNEVGNQNIENEEMYIKLFDLFWNEPEKESNLQRKYNEWYGQQHGWYINSDASEIEEILDDLFEKKAYYSFAFVYEYALENVIHIEKAYTEKYINSLLQMQAYDRVIHFTNIQNGLTSEEKKRFVIRSICENCLKYGFSHETLLLFNDEITVPKAIEMLETDLLPNKFKHILSLIILYAQNGELIKSVYLYSMYHGHAETGYTRIYSQFLSIYGRFLGKLHNHYDVILKSFEALPYKELMEFLKWASTISIPNYSEYNPGGNTFSYYIDEILKDPDNINIWKRFISHLYDHKDMDANKWLLCVTAIMAHHIFNAPNLMEIHDIIMSITGEVNMHNWPDNLLYYVACFVVDNDDQVLCEKLFEIISKSDAIKKSLYDNPWVNMHDIMEFFVEFCNCKVRENGDLLYFNMLTSIKSDLSGKDLVELSAFSVNKEFLLKKICKYFVENKNQSDAIALLYDGKIWKNLTYKESELYAAVNLLYLSYDELFETDNVLYANEYKIDRFKKDLSLILAEYPSQQPLLNFKDSCDDLEHKLNIFSVVFGIYGNDDLYNEYQLDYDDITTVGIEHSYIAFIKKCFISQLFYNSTYEFFYKLWRYFRLLILFNWNGFDSNSADIVVDIIDKYQNYDMAKAFGFEEFKTALFQLIEGKKISEETKKCVFFCLLKEDFTMICEQKKNILLSLSREQVDIVKYLTSFLDYRDINQKLFKLYYENISGKLNDDTFKVAKNLSGTFSKLVDVLSKSLDFEKDIQIVCEYMSIVPSSCVYRIINLQDDVYAQNEELYDAIIMARQLPFKIFDSIREALVKRRITNSTKRYEKLSDSIRELGYPSATAQFNHIIALECAMNGDKEGLRAVLTKSNVFDSIPIEWEPETARIITYSENDNEKAFLPIKDISYVGAGHIKKGKISFANDLFELYQIDYIDNKDVIDEAYQEFCDEESGIRERIINGLRVFRYIINNKKGNKNTNLPGYLEIAFKLGVTVSEKESAISTDKKMDSLVDIYNNCDLSKSQQQVVYDRFIGIYKELSIFQWVKYYQEISGIISASGDIEGAKEITNLCEHINGIASGLRDKDNCSTEKLYMQLENISYIGQSSFSVSIMKAVERQKTCIENSTRISVEIENTRKNGKGIVSDGFVYICVKNIGNISVDLSDDSEVELYIDSLDGKPYTQLQAEVAGIKELRTGWTTGCRVDISGICKDRRNGEVLHARVNVIVHNILICSVNEDLLVSEMVQLKETPEPQSNGYYVYQAVGDNEGEKRLFGREEEKNSIKYAISKGKAVIYGPSRIGKTSLLNWVIYSYAKERKNIITVLLGGERGNGKKNDYKYIWEDRNKKLIDYHDNENVTEHLLIDLILNGLTSTSRNRVQLPETLLSGNETIVRDICNILKQKNRTIVDRYYDIDFLLENKGYEIWILFDEFQQVLENWSNVEICEPDEFIELCDCINESSIKNVKFVFCGSDELLRQMVLVKTNSVWRRKIFDSAESVRIGPIKRVKNTQTDEFTEMICMDNAVRIPGLEYSVSALDTLCIYTDRVPLYAKEICNTVLEEIKRICGVGEFGRNMIYSYDISKATQKLMELQNYALTHSLDEDHKDKIVKIYEAVTKGLDENTDKQYLWLMAKWFMDNPSKEVFNYKEYLEEKDYELIEGEFGLRDRLEVACVRGIIRGSEESGYTFSTPFYYSAFCGTVHNLRRDFILVNNDASRESIPQTWEMTGDPVDISEKIIDLWGALAKVDSRNPEKQAATESVKQFIGTTINAKQVNTDSATGSIDEGGNTYNNINIQAIQINQIADSISELSGLIEDVHNNISSPNIEKFGDQLKGLPKLTLLSPGNEICHDDELAVYDTDSYVDTVEEGVKKSFERNQNFNGMTLSDWINTNRDKLQHIGICNEDLDYVLSLQERDRTSVIISIYLRCLFDEIVDIASRADSSMVVDYSPVTIMLGKTLERLLKEKHLPIYLDHSVWVNEVKTFSENTLYPPTVISFNGISSIGTFTTALFSMFNIAESDPEKIEKEENRDNFVERTGTDEIRWKQYMRDLNKAKKIRNKTGHVETVTKNDCNTFIRLVLNSKLLKNTIEYINH